MGAQLAQHGMHMGGHAGPGFSPGPLAYDASCAPGVLAPPGGRSSIVFG